MPWRGGPLAGWGAYCQAMSGIVVEHARRAFGPTLAVDDISLIAPPGQVTALIGPNGSGKTTLLLMLATLLAPDAGCLEIDGFDPISDPGAVRRRLGWMPDGFGTWDALTVREVLHTIAAAYDISKDVARQRTTEVLALVHLSELADHPARVLSRGQKQRLGLARALVHDPSTLLLDEPASGLDPRSRVELRDILRGLAAEGRTVLVSSHILSELEEVADRAVIVARGRTVSTHTIGTDEPGRTALVTWRVAAISPESLHDAAAAMAMPSRPGPAGTLDVDLPGDEAAAAYLRDLVKREVPVTAYSRVHSDLESAYLAATEERR